MEPVAIFFTTASMILYVELAQVVQHNMVEEALLVPRHV